MGKSDSGQEYKFCFYDCSGEHLLAEKEAGAWISRQIKDFCREAGLNFEQNPGTGTGINCPEIDTSSKMK